MDLLNAVANLRQPDSETTIYAADHRSSSSPVIVVSNAPDTASRLCRTAKAYTYFLEIFFAREFIEDFASPDLQASCDRLISYAINNA